MSSTASSITPSVSDLKGNAASVIVAFKNPSGNATSMASNMSSPNFLNPSSIDIKAAISTWVDPVNAAKADFQALADSTNSFVTCMSTALNATYESARFDPLWVLTGRLTTMPFTYGPAFATFLANTQTWAQAYDAAAAAAGVLDPEQALFDNYPGLTTTASNSVDFIKAYSVALAQDVSSVMLWAGRDVSNRDIDLPPVLKAFKASGTSDYTIIGTLFTQLATLDYSSS